MQNVLSILSGLRHEVVSLPHCVPEAEICICEKLQAG